MKTLYYKKQGRRYIPVAEYDSEIMDSFPKGNHLVMCYPGGSSRRYNIKPNYAAMIAAGRVAEDKICAAMVKASEMKPSKQPLTEGQISAWRKLQEEFGDEVFGLRGVSVHHCVDAGIKAMMEEAEKLMTNPAIKNAYENFLMVCELSRNNERIEE